MDMNKFIDGGHFAVITFPIRGAWGMNKLKPDEVIQRGFDSARYLLTLAFVVNSLSIRKADEQTTDFHLRAVSEMIREFAGEMQEVVSVLKDEYAEQIEKRDKYRDELFKLRKEKKQEVKKNEQA